MVDAAEADTLEALDAQLASMDRRLAAIEQFCREFAAMLSQLGQNVPFPFRGMVPSQMPTFEDDAK
jgi:hypothetical protein